MTPLLPSLTSYSSLFKPMQQEKLYTTKISTEQMFNSVQVCLNYFMMKYNIVQIDQLKLYCKGKGKGKGHPVTCSDWHRVGSQRYSSAQDQIQHYIVMGS
jgi:hypothetical protein